MCMCMRMCMCFEQCSVTKRRFWWIDYPHSPISLDHESRPQSKKLGRDATHQSPVRKLLPRWQSPSYRGKPSVWQFGFGIFWDIPSKKALIFFIFFFLDIDMGSHGHKA